MADRELDCRLAVCMGWKDIVTFEPSGSLIGTHKVTGIPMEVPYFSSEGAPRSYLSLVEAEIKHKGLTREYCDRIYTWACRQADPQSLAWLTLTAPAHVRARAAAEVLEATQEQ